MVVKLCVLHWPSRGSPILTWEYAFFSLSTTLSWTLSWTIYIDKERERERETMTKMESLDTAKYCYHPGVAEFLVGLSVDASSERCADLDINLTCIENPVIHAVVRRLTSLLAVVHLWPAVPTAAKRVDLTTMSMSASAATMMALLPPNSRIFFPNLSCTITPTFWPTWGRERSVSVCQCSCVKLNREQSLKVPNFLSLLTSKEKTTSL